MRREPRTMTLPTIFKSIVAGSWTKWPQKADLTVSLVLNKQFRLLFLKLFQLLLVSKSPTFHSSVLFAKLLDLCGCALHRVMLLLIVSKKHLQLESQESPNPQRARRNLHFGQ